MEKINVAIDGPAGSGKGTTAKGLAKKLNYKYLDTGAMYRSLALFLKRQGITKKEDFKEALLEGINISFDENNNVYLNGENVEEQIRSSEIGALSSDFASLPPVRRSLATKQKEIVKEKGYVAEGRDIGSVVIPDAEVKIYLDASLEVRAKRRYEDLVQRNKGKEPEDISFEELEKQLEERDKQDKGRADSPLLKVEDAIEVDTSECSIEEQIEKVYEIVLRKLLKK